MIIMKIRWNYLFLIFGISMLEAVFSTIIFIAILGLSEKLGIMLLLITSPLGIFSSAELGFLFFFLIVISCFIANLIFYYATLKAFKQIKISNEIT